VIKAAIGLVSCAATLGTGNVKSDGPPVGPNAPLPLIDDVAVLSAQPIRNHVGEGGVRGQEGGPGLEPW